MCADGRPLEATIKATKEALGPVIDIEVMPSNKDKGKGVVVPIPSASADTMPATIVTMRQFVYQQSRRAVPTATSGTGVVVEVVPSLERLLPYFWPDVLAMARGEGQNEEFSQRGIDPRQAFKPIPNVLNSESVIFDDSDVEN